MVTEGQRETERHLETEGRIMDSYLVSETEKEATKQREEYR